MSQRVVQYQAVIQMAQMAPDIYDLPQLHRNMLEVLGIKNADKLVPLEEDQKPKDPVSENMSALKCEPMKAFFYQEHDAHIQVHMMMMQDPIIMQVLGQNPKASQIQGAMMAHVAEHIGFSYRQKIEQQLGMPLPPVDEKLPPEIETQLSGMMAQAAQQLLQQNQAMAAQQQSQQQAQDPVLQMQQQELQLKQQELQLKAQEMQGKMALENKKLEVSAMAQLGKYKMAKEDQHINTMAQVGQHKMAKRDQQINAMSKIGDAMNRAADRKHSKQQMGIDLLKHVHTNQQKENPPK
jgi:hypothetical protein